MHRGDFQSNVRLLGEMRTCTPASESLWFSPGKPWIAPTGRGQIVVATLFMTWGKMRHEIDGRFDVGKKSNRSNRYSCCCFSPKSSWFHLLKAWKLFLLILSDQIWKITTAFFTGMNEKPIFRLQTVKKSASRLLTRTTVLLLQFRQC